LAAFFGGLLPQAHFQQLLSFAVQLQRRLLQVQLQTATSCSAASTGRFKRRLGRRIHCTQINADDPADGHCSCVDGRRGLDSDRNYSEIGGARAHLIARIG